MSAWHESVAGELALPRLYDLDEVVEVFDGAGFEVSVARLEMRFVPSRPDEADTSIGAAWWIGSTTTARDKVLFRFTRPSQR